MKNSNKKGFTLVELLVVIAILAILATVAVVGYTSFTDKAHESNDRSLVAQLNTAITRVEGKYATMHEVAEVLKANGFDVGLIKATAKEHAILWDMAKGEFFYVEDGDRTGVNSWIVSDTVSTKYSTYYIGTTAPGVVTLGFDAGNTSFDVVYENSANQDVIIRTNGGKLGVNDKGEGSIYWYGTANEVNIIECHTASFHAYGVAGMVEIKAGHLVAEEGAKLNEVIAEGTATVTAEKEEAIAKLYNHSTGAVTGISNNNIQKPITYAEDGTYTEGDKTLKALLVDTEEKLRNALNGTTDLTGIAKVVLTADLAWTTTKVNDFIINVDATLDLNGHSIIVTQGVTNGGSSCPAFLITNANFTLEDNAGKGYVKGIITLASTNFDLFHVANASIATMTMNSGKLIVEFAEGASSDAICTAVDVYANNGASTATFTMNGGSIEANGSAAGIRVCDNGGSGATAVINGGYVFGSNAIFVHVNNLTKNFSNNVVVNGGVVNGKYASIRIFNGSTAVGANSYKVANITLGNATYTHSDNKYDSTTYYNGAIECHNQPAYNTNGYDLWDFVTVTDNRK